MWVMRPTRSETSILPSVLESGVRWRTLAGPLAVDVAYGEREKQFRVQFSVAIAF